MIGIGRTLPKVRLTRSRVASKALLQAARVTGGGTPQFLCDLRVVKHQVDRWRDLLPGVEPFYAVKCNNDREVIRVLAEQGVSFDCASAGEMKQVMETIQHISGSLEGWERQAQDRIVYANPVKQVAHLRAARRMGSRITTFDNADELDKIARLAPNMKLLLRLATDDRKSQCRFSQKFGADEAAVPGLLRTAAALGLDVVGVSFHVGSGCYDSAQYGDALRRARLAFDAAAALGRPMEVLDIGGGFPGSLHGTITGVGDRERELNRSAPGVYLGPAAEAITGGLGGASSGLGLGGDGEQGVLGTALASVVSQAAREAALQEVQAQAKAQEGRRSSSSDRHYDDDEDGLPPGGLLLQGDPRLGPYAGGDTFREIARALRHYLRLYFPQYEAAQGARWGDLLRRDVPRGGRRRRDEASARGVMHAAPLPPMVLAEPGRYFVEASHTLMLTVSGRREVDAQMFREAGVTGRDPRARVYVTDGLYGALNSVLYDHACVAPAAVPASAMGLGKKHWDPEGPDASLPGEDLVEGREEEEWDTDADEGPGQDDAASQSQIASKFLMPELSAHDLSQHMISDDDVDVFQMAAASSVPVLPLPEDLAFEASAAGSAALAAAATVLRPGSEDSDSESSGPEGRAAVLQKQLEATETTKKALGAALAAWAAERGSGSVTSALGPGGGGIVDVTTAAAAAGGIPAWYCPSDEWGTRQHVSLWGPTCDGFDCIATDILLPQSLEVGDALLFDAAGAYTKAAGTAFNGFQLAVTSYVNEHEKWDYEVSPVSDLDGSSSGSDGEG